MENLDPRYRVLLFDDSTLSVSPPQSLIAGRSMFVSPRGAYGCNVKFNEENTQVFIVRIWIEPGERRMTTPEWRGVIENVESGKRLYFVHFDSLAEYLASITQVMVAETDQ